MKIFIKTVKPYSRYRQGQPWSGILVRKEEFHAAESRYGVDMRPGVFEGSPEAGGRLYVEANPGDVIAWGQQGIRYNDPKEFCGRVLADGSVETVAGRKEAYELLDAIAAGVLESPAPVQPAVPEPEPEPVQPAVPDPEPDPEPAPEPEPEPVPDPEPDVAAEEEVEPEQSVNPFGHD